jgi:hypothetical protein
LPAARSPTITRSGATHMPWCRAQRPDLFSTAFAAAMRALDPAET